MARFYVLLTVFQSYQDEERVMTIGCVQWNPASGRKLITSSGSRSRDSQASALKLLSYRVSGFFFEQSSSYQQLVLIFQFQNQYYGCSTLNFYFGTDAQSGLTAFLYPILRENPTDCQEKSRIHFYSYRIWNIFN